MTRHQCTYADVNNIGLFHFPPLFFIRVLVVKESWLHQIKMISKKNFAKKILYLEQHYSDYVGYHLEKLIPKDMHLEIKLNFIKREFHLLDHECILNS